MKESYFAIGLLVPFAAQAYGVKKAKANSDPKKTNVIIILADDLGYGDLGCYGAKNVKTPNVTVWLNKAYASLTRTPWLRQVRLQDIRFLRANMLGDAQTLILLLATPA